MKTVITVLFILIIAAQGLIGLFQQVLAPLAAAFSSH